MHSPEPQQLRLFGADVSHSEGLGAFREGWQCLRGGGVNSRQKRDLCTERVAQGRFKKYVREMALCDTMIGLVQALAC